MFDTKYPFRYIKYRKPREGEHFIREHMLTFSCRAKQRYIVIVEEYPYDLLVLKFFLKNHRLSEHKYELLSNLGMASGVISTCIHILLYFFEKNDKVSFGFIGARILEEKGQLNTKRFQLYTKIMGNLISTIQFKHIEYPRESAYLMVNKETTIPEIETKIIDFFYFHYLFE